MDFQDKPSDTIKSDLDEKIGHLVDGDEKVKFSSEKILSDLISSGVSVLDSLDILYEAMKYLKTGMSLVRIAKILNKLIESKGYSESALIRGKFNPLIIEYPSHEEVLTFKIIKSIVEEELIKFSFSTSTRKAIVDELYRVLKSIKTSRFRHDQIRKIIPSVVRSVLGVDPFELQKTLEALYRDFLSLTNEFQKQWDIIPDDEKNDMIVEVFTIIANIFLLTNHNLPGTNLQSTLSQVNTVISELHSSIDIDLEVKEIYTLGKATKVVRDISQKNVTVKSSDINWYRTLPFLSELISRLVHQNVIKWVIITDRYNREIYANFVGQRHNYQNLISMAMSGIQQLIQEVTSDSLKLMKQEDGYILIEHRDLFSTFFYVESNPSSYLETQIEQFVDNVAETQKERIEKFDGRIKELKLDIDEILNNHLRMMI